MEIENYLPELEAELGEIVKMSEWNPGVYHLDVHREEIFFEEYFAVLDDAPMAAKLDGYGQKMDGLRLFSLEDVTSGWHIVQYECSKYNIISRRKPVPEKVFRDIGLHAMEAHPEYFGAFPVPYYTPHGYTLRYRTLSNGIYWLETSQGKELLTVCFPIWNAELSPAAVSFGEMTKWDMLTGVKASTCYVFFSKETSCVPLYELMETRKEWENTVISLPELMNALWMYAPKYALHLSGGNNQVVDDEITRFLEASGQEAMPPSDGSTIIGMFPDAGTDFLLLK